MAIFIGDHDGNAPFNPRLPLTPWVGDEFADANQEWRMPDDRPNDIPANNPGGGGGNGGGGGGNDPGGNGNDYVIIDPAG